MTNDKLIESVTSQIDSNHKRIENSLISILSSNELNSVEKNILLFGEITRELSSNLQFPLNLTREQENEFGRIASSYLLSVVAKLKMKLD